MGRYCNSSISIFNHDKDKLKEFYQNLKSWKEIQCCSDFGKNWLGNIIVNANIGKCLYTTPTILVPQSSFAGIKLLNGVITDVGKTNIYSINLIGNELQILQESPDTKDGIKVWLYICSELLPHSVISYWEKVLRGSRRVEPKLFRLHTNDPRIIPLFQDDSFCIDIKDPDKYYGYSSIHNANENQVIELCQTVLNTKETDINVLLSFLKEFTDIDIKEWRYFDITRT